MITQNELAEHLRVARENLKSRLPGDEHVKGGVFQHMSGTSGNSGSFTQWSIALWETIGWTTKGSASANDHSHLNKCKRYNMSQPSQPFDINDPITIARHYKQVLRDVRSGRDKRFRGRHGEPRDLIAEDLDVGLNGSSLDRISRLLQLPSAVQKAISNKRITQSLGQTIQRLPTGTQKAIAADLAAGAKKSDLVAKYNLKARVEPSSELRFVRSLFLFHRKLPSEPERLDIRILRDNSRIDLDQMLDKVLEVLDDLRARLAEECEVT